jgi:alkylmercury lyase-like protein
MTWKTGPQPDGRRAERLTGPARQVRQAILAAFVRTRQPPARSQPERLARSISASPDAVLGELAETDAIAFSLGGGIRAAYPFSPIRTPIRVARAGGPAAYAMCAIDTLGMSAMLGRPVMITATEPDTGRIITVHVDGSRTRRHPEVTGRLLTQQGALGIGVAEFGGLLRAAPSPGAPAAATPE